MFEEGRFLFLLLTQFDRCALVALAELKGFTVLLLERRQKRLAVID